MEKIPQSFTLLATGQVESAEIPYVNNGFCKFQVVHGEDWQLLDGMEEGITQIARRSQTIDPKLVWNFPLDVTYKATNAFGWPQLVVAVYSMDWLGRDGIRGYGCVHIPTAAGSYKLTLKLFRPKSASLLQGFKSWLSGDTAEFADPKVPSYAEGRDVTRVASAGHINVTLNVLAKDMEAFGYDDGSLHGSKGIQEL